MTEFGDQAEQRQRERSAPHSGFYNMVGVGGPGGIEDEAALIARRNAESQEATVGGTGGSIYSTTGHGPMGVAFDVNLRDPGGYNDANAQANRDAIAGRSAAIGAMPNRQMQASTATGVDPSVTFRNQQLQLGNMLMQQANGRGPSVAGSQLQQSTEMNLQAALAQAASARGGNLGAAQYGLGNARANITQQAAQGLAQARIQEQMGARAQLGQVLDQGRGNDITTAGMAQQNNQFNAGQQQSASGANLNAGIQQDQFRQQKLNELLAMGLSYDQASAQADLQGRQFAASEFNKNALGIQGINTQANAQTIQLVSGGIGAAGSMFAGAAGAGK